MEAKWMNIPIITFHAINQNSKRNSETFLGSIEKFQFLEKG